MVKKIDGYLLTSSINHRYILKVRPFLSGNTIDQLREISIQTYTYYMSEQMTYPPTNHTVIVSSMIKIKTRWLKCRWGRYKFRRIM